MKKASKMNLPIPPPPRSKRETHFANFPNAKQAQKNTHTHTLSQTHCIIVNKISVKIEATHSIAKRVVFT